MMPQISETGPDPREKFLRDLFQRFLGPNLKNAKKDTVVTPGAIVKQLGNIYFGTSACVLVESQGMNPELDKMPDGVYRMKDYPQKEIKDVNRMRPEVLLAQRGQIELDVNELGYEFTYLPVSHMPEQKKDEWQPLLLVLRRIDDNASILVAKHPMTDLMANLRMIPYRIAPTMAEFIVQERPPNVSFASLKPTLTRSLLADMLVFAMYATRSMLFSTLQSSKTDQSVFNIRTEDPNVSYTVDGWDENAKAYKKLIFKRRPKMPKGLSNPTKKAADAAAAPTPVQPASTMNVTLTPPSAAAAPAPAPAPVVPEMPAPAPAPQTPAPAPAPAPAVGIPVIPSTVAAPVAPAAPEPQTEEISQPVDATTVPVQLAPEAAAQQPAEPAKKTRIKKPSTKQMELQHVIDNLSAAIPEYNGDIEAMINDLRPLRDLTIAVARRSANISSELYKAASQKKGEEDRLAQIRKLLG